MNAPVLARRIEAAGIATTLITQMPFWAEKIGTPRTLAVEHPFGQTLGQPHDIVTQTAVLRSALDLLEVAQEAGKMIPFDSNWPIPTPEAIAAWQPREAAPIVGVMGQTVRERLRKRRRR